MNYRKLFAKAAENWPIKVVCIGLAIILFVFHRMSSLEVRFFSVPLNIERKGALMPSSSYPRMVRVSLRGEANSIFPIMEDDIEVYVDMDGFDLPGTYTVPVQWRKKGTALGVEPLQVTVDPMEITLSLDQKISKFVPVTANFRGNVEAGYSLTSYSLNPTQVIIDGPADLMGNIFELYTEPIDLDGRRSDFTATVNLLNRDPLIVIRGSGTSEFKGNISRIIPVRNISNVPVTVTGLDEKLTAELEPKSCNVRMEAKTQEALDSFVLPRDFLTVDCSAINEPGIYVLKVHTGIAEDMSVSVDPEEVKIHIIHGGGIKP